MRAQGACPINCTQYTKIRLQMREKPLITMLEHAYAISLLYYIGL